ncbi:sensor histidine kinase [Actinobaculum suis]|uniref:sensor histidine kinase n=1 Tax=Actinobaculum suis TaxID=1657 RepID=UPI00069F779D|nr:sensor histidine kinase [Actinobaculum suis]
MSATHRRGVTLETVVGYLIAYVWLIFLIFPYQAAAELESQAAKVGPYVLITLFALIYIWYFPRTQLYRDEIETEVRPELAGGLIATTVIATICVIALREPALALFIYVVAMCVAGLPERIGARAAVPILCVIFLVPIFLGSFPYWVSLGFIAVAVYVGVIGSVHFNNQGIKERKLSEQAAIMDERERVARDVHDVLGHSLTVIAIKSELAGKLVARDPARAESEIAEITQLARSAIAEVRATVSGVRSRNLAEELASVRSAASVAGLEVDVVGDPAMVTPQHRILFSWVLREATTNTIRHAHASRISISFEEFRMIIRDDGVGFDVAAVEGNGLAGLRERVAREGGRLTITSGASGTAVDVEIVEDAEAAGAAEDASTPADDGVSEARSGAERSA